MTSPMAYGSRMSLARSLVGAPLRELRARILGGHPVEPDNLMSYGSGRSWFDAKQHRSFRAAARRQLRARTLSPAKTCVR